MSSKPAKAPTDARRRKAVAKEVRAETGEAEADPRWQREFAAAGIERVWFTTSRSFPIELVAKIAAQMPGLAVSSSHAADEALRLLDACARLLERNEESRDIEVDRAGEIAALGLDEFGERIPWRPAVLAITGQSRRDRAEDIFEKFLGTYFLHVATEDGAATYESYRALIRDTLKSHREHGFHAREVVQYHAAFHRYRDAGELEMRRAPKKKWLTPGAGGSSARNDQPRVRKPSRGAPEERPA
jgi:hypothetical protein